MKFFTLHDAIMLVYFNAYNFDNYTLFSCHKFIISSLVCDGFNTIAIIDMTCANYYYVAIMAIELMFSTCC